MKTQRSWHEFRGYRLLVAAILAAAIGAGCLRPAVAQDGESGVDDNTYTGPNYGWSVEWDDDVWEVAEESNEDESDYLVLKTLDGESPVAYTRFWGTDGVFDDPEECAADWEDRVASGEGNSDVEATDEYEAPRAPRGGASATYAYTFEDDDGDTFDNVVHFQCQYIEEDGPILTAWVFAVADEFEDAVPLYEDLIDTIEIPEDGGDDGDNGNQTEDDDSQGDDSDDSDDSQGNDTGGSDDDSEDSTSTDDDDDSGDDNPGGDGADTGIDDNQYTSPTYGYTLEWDLDVWTAEPDSELVDEGGVGLDRLYLAHFEGEVLFSGLYVESKVAYDGDLTECVDGEADLLRGDDTLVDFDLYEDDQGDPVAGESDAGGEYATYLGEYEEEDGEPYELLWYIECQI